MAEKDNEKSGIDGLVYQCELCKKMFKNPGMCPNCNVILKPRAS